VDNNERVPECKWQIYRSTSSRTNTSGFANKQLIFDSNEKLTAWLYQTHLIHVQCVSIKPTFFIWLVSTNVDRFLIIFGTYVQHNRYLFIHLSYGLLIHYLGKHWIWLERSDRAKLHVDAQNWCPIFVRMHEPQFCQSWHIDWRLLLLRCRTAAAGPAIHSLRCWGCLRILARQCTSASDGRAPSAWNSEIHCSKLMASKLSWS